ncbi:Sigma-70, region 4 [Mycobacteroides abscessus subsp. massiliense]|nr:Sigma-70, region 4 [Mycobacteroides abscessus subsp. massiliense]SKH47030.1 Sigma-70, region 4 [Mycobacteroides abscessus subsp. massiliense]
MAGRRGMRRWSDVDLEVLRDGSLTARQIAERLSRSVSAVEQARIAYAEGVPNPNAERNPAPWSEDDLTVALDRSLTMPEAAKRLNRTVGSVRSARALYSHGRTGDSGRRRRWTPADIEVLLDASLSTADVAQRLNRSVGTVYYARRRYGRKVPSDAHGTLLGWRFHGCTCEPCRQFGRQFYAQTRDPDEDNARARSFFRQAQVDTIPTATRRGTPWTDEEIAIACDPNIRAVDAAKELNRTASAVVGARRRYTHLTLRSGACSRTRKERQATARASCAAKLGPSLTRA